MRTALARTLLGALLMAGAGVAPGEPGRDFLAAEQALSRGEYTRAQRLMRRLAEQNYGSFVKK